MDDIQEQGCFDLTAVASMYVRWHGGSEVVVDITAVASMHASHGRDLDVYETAWG